MLLTNSRKFASVTFTIFIAILCLLPSPRASAKQAAGGDYKAFQERFKFVDFKPGFITHEIPASGPPLSGTSLKVVPADWQEKAGKYPDVAYEPVTAFHFDRDHDAYLILSPSMLNGKNVNLLVFDSVGTLLSAEIVAGDSGDEGNYATIFGWIRDLNGDHELDLLLREQQLALQEDYTTQKYVSDKLTGKLWNGKSFKEAALPNKNRLKQETDEDVGNFRLDGINRWTSDPRTGKSAIPTYEIWLKAYPGNSHVAQVKKSIQQLKDKK